MERTVALWWSHLLKAVVDKIPENATATWRQLWSSNGGRCNKYNAYFFAEKICMRLDKLWY